MGLKSGQFTSESKSAIGATSGVVLIPIKFHSQWLEMVQKYYDTS